MGRRSRHEPPAPQDDEEWSIDDYRSAHPIRGKYATPSGGRGPAGPGAGDPRRAPGGRDYQSGGYQSAPPALAADQYDRGSANGYSPAGYGPPQTAPDEWQQPGGPGYEAAEAYPDEEPEPVEGKKKGLGKLFRFGRRREEAEEEIWPDDGVSDEDYWASVSNERMPSTDQPRQGGSPFPPAGRSAGSRPTTMDARAVDPRAPMVTPVTGPRQQAAPRPAAGLAQPPAASANTPGGGLGMAGGPGGLGPSQRQSPIGGPGRFGGRDQDPRNAPDPRGGPPGWGTAPRPEAPRSEPNGYPDPRDLRPSARPPGRHGGTAVPPDRYQAAQSEQTETFTMPPEPSTPQAPTAQYPSRGNGRHSRQPDERGRAPYPYGQQQPEADPYDPAYRRDRRLVPRPAQTTRRVGVAGDTPTLRVVRRRVAMIADSSGLIDT
jgi:hypothetical protein